MLKHSKVSGFWLNKKIEKINLLMSLQWNKFIKKKIILQQSFIYFF